MNSMYTLFLLGTAFFLISALSEYLFVNSKLTARFVDIPDARKIHQLQIPRIGGFSFILAYFLTMGGCYLLGHGEGTLFYSLVENPHIQSTAMGILLGGIVIFIIGFFDDSTFFEVNVPVKLGMQVLAAIVAVYICDIYIDTVYLFGIEFSLGGFGKVLSLIWMVGVINSFNIIDGIDGLSASLAILSLSISSIVFVLFGQGDMLFVTVPVIAVILGFLLHNYPPAKLFAGDSGSLFLGLVVAIISVKVGSLERDGHNVETLAVFFVVALPIVEVILSIIRRYWYAFTENKGILSSIKKVVSPDNLHMHHRLIFRGLDHEQALRFLTFFSFSIASIAMIFVLTDNLYIKISALVYAFYIVLMVLKRLEYGKGLLLYDEEVDDVAVRKTIAILGNNEFFENSIRFYTEKRYWIASVSSVTDLKNRYIELFIVYNDSLQTLSDDIQKIKDVRSRFSQPIFFITDFSDEDEVLDTIESLYTVKKPVDIPYLIHDMERVSHRNFHKSKSTIAGTLAIEKRT